MECAAGGGWSAPGWCAVSLRSVPDAFCGCSADAWEGSSRGGWPTFYGSAPAARWASADGGPSSRDVTPRPDAGPTASVIRRSEGAWGAAARTRWSCPGACPRGDAPARGDAHVSKHGACVDHGRATRRDAWRSAAPGSTARGSVRSVSGPRVGVGPAAAPAVAPTGRTRDAAPNARARCAPAGDARCSAARADAPDGAA